MPRGWTLSSTRREGHNSRGRPSPRTAMFGMRRKRRNRARGRERRLKAAKGAERIAEKAAGVATKAEATSSEEHREAERVLGIAMYAHHLHAGDTCPICSSTLPKGFVSADDTQRREVDSSSYHRLDCRDECIRGPRVNGSKTSKPWKA